MITQLTTSTSKQIWLSCEISCKLWTSCEQPGEMCNFLCTFCPYRMATATVQIMAKSLTTVKVAVGHQGRWTVSYTHVILKEVATATVQTIEAPHEAGLGSVTVWVAGYIGMSVHMLHVHGIGKGEERSHAQISIYWEVAQYNQALEHN